MWNRENYLLDLSSPSDRAIPQAIAQQIFACVWRFDFEAPGFCLLDLGPGINTHDLRSTMLTLKEQLSSLNQHRTGLRFACRSLGRFDQQETTKFHLDGAPPESLLMLGYEPSLVQSRLLLADYSRCAFDLGIESQRFLTDFNPMFQRGEALLERYVTELPPAPAGHSRIVLINNSALSFTATRTNPLGVLHKASIVNPTPKQQRVVNSMMLMTGEEVIEEEISVAQQQEFIDTDKLSPKVEAAYKNGTL